MWEMFEFETGYCVTVNIYTGHHSCENTTISLGEEVVMKLASPYFNQNHHLYFDSIFTCVTHPTHLHMTVRMTVRSMTLFTKFKISLTLSSPSSSQTSIWAVT